MIFRHIFISGRVQGVGFRESTVRESQKYPGLKGFVKNLSDGRVEALFCGDEAAVLKIVAWCRKGPATAQVTRLEVLEENRDLVIERDPTILETAFARK